MSVSKVEKYTVRGITLRFIHLGQHRIEVLLNDRDKDLREKLKKASSQTSYTNGKSELNKQGNLICRCLPTKSMGFKQLVKKLMNLLIGKIERFEKKMGKVQTAPQRKQRKRHRKGYHRALAT